MPRGRCPNCPKLLVSPSGPEDAEILIVGEFPGQLEVREGRPWIGPAGRVLRTELRRIGIDPRGCRITNLWLHAVPPGGPTKARDPQESYALELDWHFRQLLDEMAEKRWLFLMGSEIAKTLLSDSITRVAGTKVKSDFFPASVEGAIASVNPAIVVRAGGVGEIRLAMGRFHDMVRS